MSESLRPKKSTNGRSRAQIRAVRLGLDLTARLSTRLASEWAEHLFTTPRRFPRPPREAALLEGAEPIAIEAGGSSLAGWSWGDHPLEYLGLRPPSRIERRPVVLLVHGWEGRGSQLGAFVAPLVAAGHRVVAFDGPAHGDSPGSSVTLPEFGEAVLAAARALGPLHGVIAHSFGAAAVSFALERGLSAQRVAYLAPAASADKATERFASFLRIAPEVRASMERSLERRTGVNIADLSGPALARRRAQPLLVVHDRADAEVPWNEGASIADAWRGARMLSTEGLGHRRLLWDAGIVSEVVAFVTAAAAGSHAA